MDFGSPNFAIGVATGMALQDNECKPCTCEEIKVTYVEKEHCPDFKVGMLAGAGIILFLAFLFVVLIKSLNRSW